MDLETTTLSESDAKFLHTSVYMTCPEQANPETESRHRFPRAGVAVGSGEDRGVVGDE